MPENAPPDYFADTVMDLLLVNGVYRLTLAKQGANREFSPAVRVLIPAPKLAAMLKGVQRASGEISSKLQARTGGPNIEGETMVHMPEEGAAPPAPEPAPELEDDKGTLGLGRKLMRRVAAKARAKKAPEKAPGKAAKSAAGEAPKKAAPRKEAAGKARNAPKGETGKAPKAAPKKAPKGAPKKEGKKKR